MKIQEKIYKYIRARDIESYKGWNIEHAFSHANGEDMLIISIVVIKLEDI